MAKFKTGTKVTAVDPVWLDEQVSGFVAKQVDSRHFLIRLDRSFRRTNPGKQWLKVCRDFADQYVTEK